jgi:hypothetical protein
MNDSGNKYIEVFEWKSLNRLQYTAWNGIMLFDEGLKTFIVTVCLN